MNEGHIKIFRKMLDWEWYNDNNTKVLFLHCLLKANWKDVRWHGIIIPRGSFITSIRTLACENNMTIQNVRTSLDKLVSTKEIDLVVTHNYTLIKLVKYNDYQNYDFQSNTAVTHKSTHKLTHQVTHEQHANNSVNISDTEFYELESNTPTNTLGNTQTNNNIRIKEYKNKRINNNILSSTSDETPQPTDYNFFLETFNSICKELPQVKTLSDSRKRTLKNIKQEDFKKICELVNESDFLSGRKGNWNATFDWIIKPSNQIKILEGNYQNKKDFFEIELEKERNKNE